MALRVVSEQAANGGPEEDSGHHSGAGPPHALAKAETPGWLTWVLVSFVVLARTSLDLVWGIESALLVGQVEISPWLRAGTGAALIVAGSWWCKCLGGRVLAQVASAVAIAASPGLWVGTWQLGRRDLVLLLVGSLLPVLIAVGREVTSKRSANALASISLALTLTAAWLLLGSTNVDSWLSGPVSTALLALGLAQLVVLAAAWGILFSAWGLPAIVSAGSRPVFPAVVGTLGLWIGVASLLVVLALLTEGLRATLAASFWVAVPFGLGIELLRGRPFGRGLALLALAGLLIQLGIIGWWVL